MTAKSVNYELWRISLSLTYQGVFITRNAKTLGFYHLQLSDVGPGRESVWRTSTVRSARKRNELFIKRNVFSDGQPASSVKE